MRELDERLGFGDLIAEHLTDGRRGKNTPLPLADLLRQSVYSRIARSDVPADRFEEDLGARGGADSAVAIIRDRLACPRGESRRSGRHQS